MLRKIAYRFASVLSVIFILVCCMGLFSDSNIAYAPGVNLSPKIDTVLLSEDSISAYWKRMVKEKKKFRTSKQIRDEQSP